MRSELRGKEARGKGKGRHGAGWEEYVGDACSKKHANGVCARC